MGIISNLIKQRNDRSSNEKLSEDVNLTSDEMAKLKNGDAIVINYKHGVAVLKIKQQSLGKPELTSEDFDIHQVETPLAAKREIEI